MLKTKLSKKQIMALKGLEKAFQRCKRDKIVLYASDCLLAMTEDRYEQFEAKDAPEITNAEGVIVVEDYRVIADRGAP